MSYQIPETNSESRNPPDCSKKLTSADLWLVAALAGLLLAIYAATLSLRVESIDELAMLATARSLSGRGALDADLLGWIYPIMGRTTVIVPGYDGHFYGLKDIGGALVTAPLVWAASRFELSPMRVYQLAGILATLLTAGMVFVIARQMGYRRRTASLAMLTYGLATLAWPYGRTIFTQVFAAPGLLLAAWGCARMGGGKEWRWAALAGVGIGWAGLNATPLWATLPVLLIGSIERPPAGTFAGLWRWGCDQVRRTWLPLLLAAAPFGLLQAAYNLMRFGSPFTGHHLVGGDSLDLRYGLVGVPGYLFSFPRGIIWYVPMLVLGVIGARGLWRQDQRRLPLVVASQFVIMLVVYGSFFFWWGGGSVGPRYLVPVIPGLVLLCLPILDWAMTARPKRAWPVWALIVVSVGFQGLLSLFDLYNVCDQIGMYPAMLATTPPEDVGMALRVLFDPRYWPPLLLAQSMSEGKWLAVWMARGQVDTLLLAAHLLAIIAGTGAVVVAARKLGRGMNTIVLGQIVLCLAVVGFNLTRYPNYSEFSRTEIAPTPGLEETAERIEAQGEAGDQVFVMLTQRPYEWLEAYDSRRPEIGLTHQSQIGAEMESLLERRTAADGRVWLVTDVLRNANPDNGIERWLASHAYAGPEVTTGSIRTIVYGIWHEDPVFEASGARFGPQGEIELVSYGMAWQPTVENGAIDVWLRWRIHQPIDQPYTVFVHILDANGTLVGQHDGWPVAGYVPFVGQVDGAVIDDRHHAPISLPAPDGQYRVVIGLYDSSSGERLLLTDSDLDGLELGVMSAQ